MLLLLLVGPLCVVAILMEPAILLIPLAVFIALAFLGLMKTPAERRRVSYNGSGHMHTAEDITSGRLDIHAHGPNCAGKRVTVHDHRWAGTIQRLKMTGKWWPEGHPRY